ncbi:polysaccharide pyruvyl transferase family protein [Segatella copri]|uniref:polysaccharide pyruvyl transferase family protein n=1 Tax=Segatella copri TaxID=165179 RepID=UPI003F8A1087
MKIKTITCHHVYNYGASLQAYALQHYLESLGHEVEIIDFNPWFHCDRYNPFWMPKNAIGRAAQIIKILPFMRYIWYPYKAYKEGMFKTWGRKAAFDKFEKEYYHLTSIKYYSSEQLQKNPPRADVYVAGSDQIWNTFCENGKEPGYYLDFGDKTTKRLSYAASLATSSIRDGMVMFVKSQLQKFNAISVREKTGAQLLKEIGIQKVSVVLDPVFLLDENGWRNLSKKGNLFGLKPDKYLLVYDFLGNDSRMASFSKKYAKKHSLKIVSVNDFNARNYADVNINNAGPLEFLALIDNAACVVASSFHATAFSVIFKKEFYTFNLKGYNNSSRMQDLLVKLGLEGRMNPKGETSKIKWSDVSQYLEPSKVKSKSFLVDYL